MEGSEPPFFTRFFTWDSAKSAVSNHKISFYLIIITCHLCENRNTFILVQMHGNSFQRKLALVKNGGTPMVDVRLRLSHLLA